MNPKISMDHMENSVNNSRSYTQKKTGGQNIAGGNFAHYTFEKAYKKVINLKKVWLILFFYQWYILLLFLCLVLFHFECQIHILLHWNIAVCPQEWRYVHRSDIQECDSKKA